MPESIVGQDGLSRCPWGHAPPDYRDYHDREWGRPVADEGQVYEKLCLEGFQSGLSWLTILRKREAFRVAFAGFSPPAVAAFDEEDIARLLANPGIVRHRGKIEAVIANAKAVVALWAEGLTLAGRLWSYEEARRAPEPASATTGAPPPALTPASVRLSKELRARGFKFVGPTTVYSAMQSLGVVNDHISGCYRRAGVDEERASFSPPLPG